jgi:hypothetical protein
MFRPRACWQHGHVFITAYYSWRFVAVNIIRVKLEQASKVKSWMPTRLNFGEGRAEQGRNRHVHLF